MRGFKTIKKQPTQPQSQSQPQYEIADILNKLGSKLEDLGLNSWQLRTLSALKKCRTSALGGHIDACDECGNVSISYNSCRNRHCPKCQGQKPRRLDTNTGKRTASGTLFPRGFYASGSIEQNRASRAQNVV
jgi:hypothetical protein